MPFGETIAKACASVNKADLARVMREVANNAAKHIAENPKQSTIIAVAAIPILVPTVVIAPIFLGLGFGATGPVAGTVAAGLQASIGNVGAGSAFATVQSAAMGGAGAAIVNGVVQAGGALLAAVSGLWDARR